MGASTTGAISDPFPAEVQGRPAPDREPVDSPKTVFRHRGARRLVSAQLISQICDRLMLVAVVWHVTTRSAGELAPWFLALSALPHLLLGWSAPGWIARLGGPLRAVVRTDAARGLIFVAGALWLAIAGPGSSAEIPLLFGLAIAANAAAAVFNPAIFSLPVLIAPAGPRHAALVARTTALIESCLTGSALVAPALSTLLYATLGLPGLLLVNGLSYLVAAALETRIVLPASAEAAVDRATPAPGDLPHGVPRDFLIHGMLIAFFAMNLLLGPVLVFLPLFARQVYAGSLGTLASLETALGGGTLLGSLLLSTVANGATPAGSAPGTWPPAWKKISLALGATAAAYAAFTFTRSPLGGVLSVGVLGFALAIANVSILGFFQSRSEPARLTALMSWVNVISVASLPVSMGVLGIVLGHVQLPSVARACSTALILVTALTAMLPAWAGRRRASSAPYEGKAV